MSTETLLKCKTFQAICDYMLLEVTEREFKLSQDPVDLVQMSFNSLISEGFMGLCIVFLVKQPQQQEILEKIIF